MRLWRDATNNIGRFLHPIGCIRILFILTMTLCGYWIGETRQRGLEFSSMAFLLALFIVTLEYSTRILSAKKVVFGGVGAFFGLAFSRLFYDTFPRGLFGDAQGSLTAFSLLFMYIGAVMGLRYADRVSLSRLQFFLTSPKENSLVFDTSVIIDGRVGELYEMGFLTKTAIVPTFVLQELQQLADSRDAVKRHNGRRGLEHLEHFRQVMDLQIFDKDYPEIPAVDEKLILLSKDLSATLLTNDYYLTKVASLHNVRALNLNHMSTALRPQVNVGQQFMVKIVREGKDPHQGVAYLEDGTMVVVDDARELIGEEVPIVIVSMMQTNAGRLVFGRLLEARERDGKEESSSASQSGVARIEMVTHDGEGKQPKNKPQKDKDTASR